MSILSDKKIYEAMLPHLGTFTSYRDLVDAAYRETLKMVLGKMNERDVDGEFPEWALSHKDYIKFTEVSNGH